MWSVSGKSGLITAINFICNIECFFIQILFKFDTILSGNAFAPLHGLIVTKTFFGAIYGHQDKLS